MSPSKKQYCVAGPGKTIENLKPQDWLLQHWQQIAKNITHFFWTCKTQFSLMLVRVSMEKIWNKPNINISSKRVYTICHSHFQEWITDLKGSDSKRNTLAISTQSTRLEKNENRAKRLEKIHFTADIALFFIHTLFCQRALSYEHSLTIRLIVRYIQFQAVLNWFHRKHLMLSVLVIREQEKRQMDDRRVDFAWMKMASNGLYRVL